jgi:hypothetical protein
MKTKIVIAVVDIELAGEYKHFEMRIPDDIKSIVGIETSVRFTSAIWEIIETSHHVVQDKNFAIGDVRLNGGKYNHWFYANTITECLTDYKEDVSTFELNTTCFQPIKYNKKREADNCNIVPNGTRIKGFYKDVLGTNLQTDLNYSITISIHLNTA